MANHVFGAKSNKCALAYSKVQVDCDICRACTIEERGGIPGRGNRLGALKKREKVGLEEPTMTKKLGGTCNGFEYDIF